MHPSRSRGQSPTTRSATPSICRDSGNCGRAGLKEWSFKGCTLVGFGIVLVQSVQWVPHRVVLEPAIEGIFRPAPPVAVTTLLDRLQWLRAIPEYFLHVRVRPERAPVFARRLPV